MFNSRKLWIPVGISILITLFAGLNVLMLLGAGGAHGRNGPGSPELERLMFPFAALLENGLGNFFLIAMACLLQFPGYGAIIGYWNYKEKLVPALASVTAFHLLAFFLSSAISR